MKTYFDCLSCFVKQVLGVARFISRDEQVHEKLLRACFAQLAEIDLKLSPPETAALLYRKINEIAGVDDPYFEIKQKFNRFAMDLYPAIKATIASSEEPLGTAVKMAIAGNIIDFGVSSEIIQSQVCRSVAYALEMELERDDFVSFKTDISKAKTILYIGDNCGEIVFDRALIEQIGPERITFAVRSRPVINDVTVADAREVGLSDIVTVVENGWDGPGTALDKCSKSFCDIFASSDVIISKGQGNYETLSEAEGNIYFMLKIKCPVVAENISKLMGSIVLKKK